VAILVTQKVDDIPFDLKHRAHIVYDGNIEKLRKLLSPREQQPRELSFALPGTYMRRGFATLFLDFRNEGLQSSKF
jgi:hypothetical protein